MIWEKLFFLFNRWWGREAGLTIGQIKGSIFKPEVLTEAELNHHVHIVGASGFGKSVLLSKILKSKVAQGHGAMLIDLKNDQGAIDDITSYVKECGREDDLKIFSISNPSMSCHYNIIQAGNPTEIRDKIMSSFTWSNEYYENETKSYLLKVLIVLKSLNKTIDLKTVGECVSSIQAIEDLVLSIPKAEVQLKLLAEDCYHYLSSKDGFHNLSGLRSQIQSLHHSEFGEKLIHSADSLNLFNAVNNNQIVLIILDSRRYGESAKAMGKMIIRDLIATSARIDAEVPKELRKPFAVCIDEFADLAQESFTAFPDRARSSKMSLILSHQDLSDLKQVSPEFANRLTANMSTLYAFLQANDESANAVAKRAGSRSVWKDTHQTERILWWEVVSGKGSRREVEEFIIHPNIIKSLKVGEAVVVKKYPHARSHVVRVDEK